MSKMLMSFVRDESGQDLAEYALLLVLIAVGVVGVVMAFGDNIKKIFTAANTELGKGVTAADGTPTPNP